MTPPRRPTHGYEPGPGDEPTPAPQLVDGAAVERISRQICDAEIPYHELHCSRAQKIEEKLTMIERTQTENVKLLSGMAGAFRLAKWVVPIIVALLSSSMAAVLFHYFILAGKP